MEKTQNPYPMKVEQATAKYKRMREQVRQNFLDQTAEARAHYCEQRQALCEQRQALQKAYLQSIKPFMEIMRASQQAIIEAHDKEIRALAIEDHKEQYYRQHAMSECFDMHRLLKGAVARCDGMRFLDVQGAQIVFHPGTDGATMQFVVNIPLVPIEKALDLDKNL